MPLGTTRFWGCSVVLLVCTVLMVIYVERSRLNRNPLMFWILKDLVACNTIGFDLWYRSIESAAMRTRIRVLGSDFYGLIISKIRFLFHGLYSMGHLIIGGILLLVIYAMYQNIVESNRYAARSFRRLERKVEAASNNITVAINQNTIVTERALLRHGNLVKDASTSIVGAINQHGFMYQRALTSHGNQVEAASRSMGRGLLEASRVFSSAMDRNAVAIDRTLRIQNRQIEAAARNVVTGMHLAAQNEGNIIAGVLRRSNGGNRQQALEYPDRRAAKHEARKARLDMINTGLNTGNAVLGVVGALGSVGCTVM